jgi:hypothetical protein
MKCARCGHYQIQHFMFGPRLCSGDCRCRGWKVHSKEREYRENTKPSKLITGLDRDLDEAIERDNT